MKKDEALALALEALESAIDQLAKPYSTQAQYAITAIKQARSAPVQKPYRPLQDNGSQYFGDSWDTLPTQSAPVQPVPCCGKYETCTQACTPRGKFLGARDAAAQPAPTVQEPVAIADGTFNHNCPIGTPLYTTAAQRPFVGLTDEEIMGMYNEPRSDAEMIAFGREVEAELKEKNT